ncbi:MAG: uncharacterized protein JWP64_4046 [Pseudonocardia sp.]|nr:uncharacterized protein [Pseudonocardia sp.]
MWKFDSAGGAESALELLERLQKEELIRIGDAAYVSWPRTGRSRGPSSSPTPSGHVQRNHALRVGDDAPTTIPNQPDRRRWRLSWTPSAIAAHYCGDGGSRRPEAG